MYNLEFFICSSLTQAVRPTQIPKQIKISNSDENFSFRVSNSLPDGGRSWMDTVHGTLFHTYLMQGTGDIDRLILDQACRMLVETEIF